MATTTIECPSCNRRINIALVEPLCTDPNDLFDVPRVQTFHRKKEWSLMDILYVHEELIEENKYLRKVIDKYETLMDRN